MAVTVELFRSRFPEFADSSEYSGDRIQIFLDDAADDFMGGDENRWGGDYDKAQAYLGAHLLAMGTATEAGDVSAKEGVVISKSAGGVSVTKSVMVKDVSDTTAFLKSTAYGQRFLTYRRNNFSGAISTGSFARG